MIIAYRPSHRFIIPMIYSLWVIAFAHKPAFAYAYIRPRTFSLSLSLSPSGRINPSLRRAQPHGFSFSICLCHQHPLYWDEAPPWQVLLHHIRPSLLLISSTPIRPFNVHDLLDTAIIFPLCPYIAVLLPLFCLWFKWLQLLVEYLHFSSCLLVKPKSSPQHSQRQHSHLRSFYEFL